MSTGSDDDLISYTELFGNGESEVGVWETKNINEAFVITSERVFKTNLTDTAGRVFSLPFDSINAFEVKHDRTTPDYVLAIVLGILGMLVLGFPEILPSGFDVPVFIWVFVGFLFILAAVIAAYEAHSNEDRTTELTFHYRDETFEVDVDGNVGSELAVELSKRIN